jgi:DNA-binding MarR family transcriptional regulator
MQNDPDEIIIPFFNVFKLFKRRMKGFSDITMSIMEVGALHYISKKGHVTMKELSEFLEITPPSTTALIDKMIKINILKRSFNEDDRRSVILSLTKKGEEMFKKAKAEKIKIGKEIFSCLNEKEYLELHLIFKKILKKASLKNN